VPDDKKAQDDLRKCMKAAGNDAAKRAACEAAFKADGGSVDGGKVFTTPDGEATFVTNGGKVFNGKA
jgi:hypothetical protein